LSYFQKFNGSTEHIFFRLKEINSCIQSLTGVKLKLGKLPTQFSLIFLSASFELEKDITFEIYLEELTNGIKIVNVIFILFILKTKSLINRKKK